MKNKRERENFALGDGGRSAVKVSLSLALILPITL